MLNAAEIEKQAQASLARIMKLIFPRSSIDFGGARFSMDSLSKSLPRGNHCLSYNSDGTWLDSVTGEHGNGLISFTAYARRLSPVGAAALLKNAINQDDRIGITQQAVYLQQGKPSVADIGPRDSDITQALAKRHLSPQERNRQLIQAVKNTLHSRYDKRG